MGPCSNFRNDQILLAQQLQTADVMFRCFLFLQYRLGDSFLKSSKDFIK